MDLPNGARLEVMKRYLFQEMSDAEREDIEEQFFQDETYFYELVDLENELLDGYARGDLRAEEKARLERSLSLLPERRERLVQAVALQRLIAAEEKSLTPSERDQPPEVVPPPRPRRTLADMLLRPSPAFALASLLIVTNVAVALAYFEAQRMMARERRVHEEQLRRVTEERDEARKRYAELAHKEPDETGVRHAEPAGNNSQPSEQTQGPTPPRVAENARAAAGTPRASRANRNLSEASAGGRQQGKLNQLRQENAEQERSIPEVVHAPGEYEPTGNTRGKTAGSSARPKGWIQIGPRTTSVKLTLRLSDKGLSAEDVPNLRFVLTSGGTDRPIVPLNKSLSKRRSLVVNLLARDLSDGVQILKVMIFDSWLGDYELRVKRY